MIEEEEEEPIQQRASTLQIGVQPKVAFNTHQHCVTPDGYDDFYSQMSKSSSLPMPRTSSVRSLPAQFDEPIAWKDGMQGTVHLAWVVVQRDRGWVRGGFDREFSLHQI